MTISPMAMNVGHQVFLSNSWGLKGTRGKTNTSSLNTPSQQLHSEGKVMQRRRCKQRNRAGKYSWPVSLRESPGCWPSHPLLPVRRCVFCDLFLVCGQHPSFGLKCCWKVNTKLRPVWNQRNFLCHLSANVSLYVNAPCRCICSSCSTGDCITPALISKQLWKFVGELYSLTGRGEICKDSSQMSQMQLFRTEIPSDRILLLLLR